MQRTGPESLMLMAAAPLAYRTDLSRRALWELPAELRAEDRREVPLAALGAGRRQSAGRRLLAWVGLGAGEARRAERTD